MHSNGLNASHDDLRHMQKVNNIASAELDKKIDYENVLDQLMQARCALAAIKGYTDAGLEWGKQEAQSWEEDEPEDFRQQQLNERRWIDCEEEIDLCRDCGKPEASGEHAKCIPF